jgi:acetyl-CoA carboxylase biotin carboxylase subunit
MRADGEAANGPLAIRRLLIANRGEIAVRVIRACRDLGIEAVVAFSEADRDSMAVRMADRGICIGPPASASSYLNIGGIVTAAAALGCDAIHPGYGFLAENAELAAACEEQGIIFVGPRSETIALLGDKIAARQTAQRLEVPVIPGSSSDVTDVKRARSIGERIGFPLLIKAGGGGGGRGLRLVESPDRLERSLAGAAGEARLAFGNEAVYIERFITRARHIEVQIAADEQGHVLHFGERDCSVQRNYQKLVEEAPSPVVEAETRSRIAETAVRLLEGVDYRGVGTVEFLLDQDSDDFYFIEVNTRIQVEHPVTEIVTGHDLIALQLRLAGGAPLRLEQQDIGMRGHAIEFRINAEDPDVDFRPSAGRIEQWRPPEGPGVRVDTHCFSGYEVPPFYDSLLAKLIVYGRTREEVLGRSRRAFGEYAVVGVESTIGFHQWLLDTEDFSKGRMHTAWVAQKWKGSGAA